MDRSDLMSAAFGSVIVGALVWFILHDRQGPEDAAPVEPAIAAAPAAEPEAAPAPEAPAGSAAEAPAKPEAEEAAASDEAKPEAGAPKAVDGTADAAAAEEASAAKAAEMAKEPEGEPETEAAPAPEETAAGEEDRPLGEPVFDIVRIEPDGSGLVAGRAAPGSTVEVVIEGEVVAEVVAGPHGAFVAFIQVERKAEAVAEAATGAGAEAVAPEKEEPEMTAALAPATNGAATEDAGGGEPAVETKPQAASNGPPKDGDAAAGEERAETIENPSVDESQPPVESAVSEEKPEAGDGRAAEMQAASGLGVAAQSIILRARPGETLFVVESAPVFVVGGSSAEAAPLIVQPEEGGLRLVQPPSRPATEDVTLDTISYDAEGRVVFAGRARPEGVVRLYLDAAAIAEAPVADDGSWRTRAAEPIKAGVYVLRLDQVDAAGKVTSRIEMPFLREAITEGPVGDNTITVQSGDNLWRISENFYGEGVRYTVIYGANKGQIRNPDLIYPGQIFTIPDQPRSE